MKALISWEDENGSTQHWELVFDPNDAAARRFLEALQLHVRFRVDSFDPNPAAN
ncbi:MAG TPA: hypothetical protein VFV41_07155 [Streptosporangiaceae bacterium]|nr:hypothetical protein [Streptosporangiaceae bacterium]